MPVNLASRASAIATDSQGKTHVVWAEGSFLWYAQYDNNSETWKNAQAITRLENQDISNISFLYNDNLIQEGTTNKRQPGFVVTWQQGSENNSDLYYTAGEYDENQQLQWLANPQAITTDQVADLEPTALVYNGEVLLVGSKVNIQNANHQQIREDNDLYYQQFTVNDSLFTSTTTTPPNAFYSPQISQDGVISGLIPINQSTSNDIPSFSTTYGQNIRTIESQNLHQETSSLTKYPQDITLSQSQPFNQKIVFLGESLQSVRTLKSENINQKTSFRAIDASSSEAVVPEYAFAWSGGINFETTLLEVLKAKETAPAGIVQKILSPFIKEVKIQGSVKGGQNSSSSTIIGSSGDNLNPYLDVSATTVFSGQLVKKIGTLVVAPEVEGEELAEEEAQKEADKATQGKSEDEENSSNSSFNLSIGLDSTWTFDRDTRVLTSIFDTITLSFGVEFPVFKVPLFDVKLYADVGASFYVQAEPIEGGDYDPPLSAILEVLGGEALGTGVASFVGALTNAISTNNDASTIKGAIAYALASAVFSTLADALTIANNSDELDYQTAFGFPILNGGASFQLGLDALNFSGKAGIEAGLVWGIGDTPNVQFLLFPIDAGINLGPIYFGITLRPGWTWEQDTNNNDDITTSDVSSSLANSTTESSNAMVQGSLLTINWGENLNPANIPDSSQFIVTVTDNLGRIITIPVFQVSIEGNTIQLRLSQVIPLSANYDYTTSDNPTPQPNLIQVSYTTSDNQSQNLQDSQGEEIHNFNFSVTNTTPDSFSAVYNPTTGNSQNYSILNNELILNFNTPFNTNIIPDVRRFTIEGVTIESVTVESNAVVLKLDKNVANVTVTYSNQEGLGNFLETINNESIASFSIENDITVSQSQFVIGVQFTNTLNSNLIPNINQFLVQTIDNNGNVINTVTVNQVDIVNDNTVNLYLSQAIEDNQTYRITYTQANNIATDLEYQDGTEVEGFTIVSNQENSQGITTNELTAIFIQNLHSNVTFSNSLNNYNVSLTDALGNIENSVTLQSLRLKSQGIELIINHNLTDTENVVIDYENNDNEIKINSLVTGIEPPQFNTQSVIGNIEADLGQDSNPTLSLTKTGEVLMAWVTEVPPIEPIAGFVNGNVITLNFVDILGNSTSNEPSLNQFTVTDSNDNNYNVTNISTVNNTLTLTLNTAVNENTELIVNYALSSSNYNSNLHLENDSTGTRLWISDFSFNLDNITGNTNPPALLGAGAIIEDSNSNKITLVFDQNLQGNPDNSQFTIQSNGVNYSIEPTITVNNNTVTLSVQPPNGSNLIGIGDIVTVSYQGNSLRSIHGNVIDFNNQPVITSPTTPTTVIKYGFTPSGDALLSNLSSIIGSKGLNFNPVAGLDQNGNNVVMWVNADMSDIPTNLTPGEFYSDNQIDIINESLSQSDIYYSIYNANTKQWSIASPLISQEGSEGKIVVGMGENNQLIASWLNYIDDETQIYWSSLAYDNQGNGIWSEPQLLYQSATPDPLTELEIANINGKTGIFWTETQQVSYSQLTIDGNPILYLRLDEGSGTIANNSGTWGAGGNGTYNGTVNYNQEGALENTTTKKGDKNPSVLFNNGSSLTLAEDLSLISSNSFSIELWFKIPNNPSETLNIASMEGLFNLSLSQSLQLSLNIDNQNISLDSPIDTDIWNYLVVTYSQQSETVILYLNGQPVITQNNIDFTLPSTTNLTLAGGNDNLYLDEVAFYNKILDYSDFIPSDLNSNNISSLTAEQLISILSGDGMDIGSKYSAQYIAPLPPGANTYYAFIDDDTDTPSQIIPEYQVIATQLSSANKPEWDIVSNVSANSNGYIYPNGIPDIYLPLNLQNQQTGTKIQSIVITAQDSNGNTLTWSVGNTQGNQLGVVQGETLLNPINPDGEFDYTILSPNVNLDLFIDGSNNNLSNFQYSINGSTPQSINTADVTSEPTTVNSNQVLGIATVTEANDSSLSLIDSGFIINTDNASMGYILSNGDLDGDGKTDVIVGNRGYTDSNGNLLNNGTIQILFGNGTVLSDSENNPLTSTDLSGNPDGIFIKGIIDGGQANSDFPMSLATGDVDGDGKDDLIIGAPNGNPPDSVSPLSKGGWGGVYVIKGSYLANNKGKTITINSDNSFSDGSNNSSNIGYVINPTVEGGYFGYSVAVGNFNGTGNADIAIGTPGANNGDGLVSIVYDGSNTATTFYTGTNKENLGYALTVSKAKGGQSFSKNTTIDDLIVGAPSFQASIANQWVGVDSFPQDNQNLFPSNTSASVGKVYVFANNSINPLYSFTGSILPSSNGTAENSFTGSALASDDWDGDGIKDLAISAPGSDTNDGLVYVLKGGSVTSGDLDYLSNLIILGGLQFGQAGSVITSAGDVNGDKYEDFLITAPQGGMGAGQGYVLFGPLNLNDVGTLFDLNVTATDNKKTFLLNSDRSYQSVGSSASPIGDVNNDGVDDLMITAPNAQQLYVVYGHQWLADDGSIKLADISSNNGFVIDGDLYNVNSQSLNGNGNNVLMLGDINGDGFADVFSGGSENGAVIIFGSSTKNLLDASVGSNDLIVTVANRSLKDVMSLGDFNGDGLQDFGVIDDDNNFYIQLGSNNLSSLGNLSLSNPSVTSITDAIKLGDYNGDGYDDILLNTSSNSLIYLGNEEGNVNNSLTFNPVGGNSFSDYTFGSIGDIDGDGYQDIATGLPQSNFTIQNGANGQFTIYTNRGNQSILPPVTPSLSNFPSNDYNPSIASYGVPSQESPVPPNFAVYQGYLYMTFKGNGNDDINVMRSRDGITWENQVVLTSLQTPYSPSLIVFEDKLYLIHTFENGIIYITPFTGDNDSISFGEYTALITGAGTSPTPIVFDNKLYIFYIADGDDQINYITLSDPANITEFGYDEFNYINDQQSFDRTGVTLTPDGQKLVLAYKNSNKADVYITNFDGSNWSEGKIVQDSQNNNNTIETTDGVSLVTVGNNIYLAYEGTNPNDLRYIYSQDSGNSWEFDRNIPNQLVNGGASLTFFQSSLYFGYSSQVTSNAPLYVSYSEPIYNTNQTQQLGEQLYTIGDFNGDGIEDFAVLASGYIADLGIIDSLANLQIRNNQGAILIYYGNANGINDINNSAQPDVVLVNPPVTDSNSPFYEINSFTSLGDINGDGYDDMAVASPSTNNNEGVVFVVFGGSDWKQYSTDNPFNLGSLSNNQSNGSNVNGFVIKGLPSSQAGISISGGGDVNGDGLSDFTIGAPGNNDNLTYVIFGSDFNNTVNQTGTIGNDRMIGTVTGESFLGGEGNDKIYTNGGIDVVYAGVGDDFVTVHDTYFRRLDGGTGIDTLKFTGYNGQDWDLTSLSPGNRLRNFEILDIKNYGANTLTLNSLTVTQLSSTNTITVLMDENDIVNLSADFSYNDTIYEDNQIFYQYTSSQSSAKVRLNRHVEETNTVQLLLNEEGSLVLLSESGEQLWTAEKDGQQVTGAVQALMQTDGNFVLYNTLQPVDAPGDAQFALWASDTVNDSDTYLQLGADGGLYIKNSDGEILTTLNAGNSNITDFVTFSQQQDLVNNQSLIAEGEVIANVTFNAPSTNTPQPILNPEVVSQVSAQNTALFTIDELGNISAVSTSLSSSDNQDLQNNNEKMSFRATAKESQTSTRLFVSNPIANEADGKVEFKIDRTGNLDKYVQVHYITEDRRGKAGSDYHPVLGRVVFKPGESSKTVSVVLPLDDVYTGTREFGLLVTQEKESDTPLTDEFHLHVNPSDGQIRNWNHIIKEQPHSIMGGILEFRVTTTEGKGEIKLYFEGEKEFNSYYILNNETQKYEPFTFNGTTGAEFFDEDGDNKYEGVILHLQDGDKFDLDGVENGLAFKRGFFSNGETPEILLDTAMYRFRSLDTQGSYLYVGEQEKESILSNYSDNFIEEGLAFYVSDTPKDDLIAFNRFRNSSLAGGYIYAGEAESESIRANYPQFIEEGIAFYAYSPHSQIADQIDRFQNSIGGAYLYTGQPETNNVITNYENSFYLEGIAFEGLLA